MGQFALAFTTLLFAIAGTAHAQGSPSSQLPSTSIFTSVGAAAVVAVLAVGLVAAFVARRRRTSKSVNAGDMHLHSIHTSSSNNSNTHEIQCETGFGDVDNVYDFYTQNDLSSLHSHPDNAPQLVAIQTSDIASDLEEIVSLSFGSSSRTSILSISSSILYPEENCAYSDSDETTVEDIVSVYSYELDEDSLDGIGMERYLQ
ncbi:hypothetical protein BJ741DRAFT_598636 [Chytriomyces cf. hyalinus JEL632]|nr:hypothetical protein BJ741DRAFT_598636 [Chytriomyces cf. hyalinus JEL632]